MLLTWHKAPFILTPWQEGYALYFSRAPIPAGHAAALPAPGARYLLHLGLQARRRCRGARALAR